MDTQKKLYLAAGISLLALVLLWRFSCRKSPSEDRRGAEPVFICVACGKQFPVDHPDIDPDAAAEGLERHEGAECPACHEKKLSRARRCPNCGHCYVPKPYWSPGATREDDTCPECGTPTFTNPRKPRPTQKTPRPEEPPPG